MKPEIYQEQVSMQELLPFLDELLKDGKTVQLKITGNSMMPLLRNRRDSVMLVAPENVKKYDIVLFVRESGEAILHRIVGCKKEGYIIVGDNQLAMEGPIKPAQVVAKVSAICRDGRIFQSTHWWCRLYGCLWGFLRPVRKPLLPLLLFAARRIKRIEHMNGEAK